MNMLKQFVLWIDVLVEQVVREKLTDYVDFLMWRKLKPKTINCHIGCIRAFYEYLEREEVFKAPNPVRKRFSLRLPRPLPRFLNDDEVERLFEIIKKARDRAMFILMLRTGLRVEEVARLTLGAIDLKRRKIFVHQGKDGKDRVVYISSDSHRALIDYLRCRPLSKSRGLFLVEKGDCRRTPISVRGIQKRIEYYSGKAELKVSYHQLRHTMAT
jgi:integrase/recombinase XerD